MTKICPEEMRREVQASEILEKIQKGQDVRYDNVVVKGDLDLSKLDLPTQQVKLDRTYYWAPIHRLKEDAKIVSSNIINYI